MTTSVAGRPILVSLVAVSFGPVEQGKATELTTLAAQNGTGDVNNLIRDGTTYPAGPTAFAPNAAQATTTTANGNTAWIAEAMWADGSPTADSDPALKQACQNSLTAFAT